MQGALSYRPGERIGEIVLNQPDRRNAISAAMWAALGDAVCAAGRDDAALIVVRGEGGHFAAGADISEFETVYRTPESAERYTKTMLDALSALEHLEKPTLAAIRGSCVGGGVSIALACDFRFADMTARIGVTPGKLGLAYSLADTRRLAAAAGAAGARDLLLTGRLIAAEEALRIGLVDRAVAADALDGEVRAFAETIAATSGASAALAKRTLRLLKEGAADEDPRAAALMREAFSGADFREGYRAFLEKRAPDFPSRRPRKP